MPVLEMEGAMEAGQDRDADVPLEAAESTESTAFLRPELRSNLAGIVLSSRSCHHRTGLVIMGVLGSLMLVAVLAVGSAHFPSKPAGPGRARTGRFRLSLWSGPGSCSSMGCDTDNYVGSCQCNDGCVYFDDCCPDYEDICASEARYPSSEPQGSCADLGCGSDSAGCNGLSNCANLCQCVPSCREAGNCCQDFETLCADGGSQSDLGTYVGDGEAGQVDDGPGYGQDGDGSDKYANDDYDEAGGWRSDDWRGYTEAATTQQPVVRTTVSSRQTSPPSTKSTTTQAPTRPWTTIPRTSAKHTAAPTRRTTTTERPTKSLEDRDDSFGHGSKADSSAEQTQRYGHSSKTDSRTEQTERYGHSSKTDSSTEQTERYGHSSKTDSRTEQTERYGHSSKTESSTEQTEHYGDSADGHNGDDGDAGGSTEVDRSKDSSHTASSESSSDFEQRQAALVELLKWQQVKGCPAQVVNRDILKGADAGVIRNVPSAAHCQKLCTEKDCDGSVWGAVRDTPGLSDTCFLKKFSGSPQMTERQGVIAALPCCRQPEDSGKCPKPLLQTDLVTHSGFDGVGGVTSASACQDMCTKTHGCAGFSWGAVRNVPGLTDVCFMKKLKPDETPKLLNKKETIAGLPCGCRTPPKQALWPTDEVHIFEMPKPASPRRAAPGSCFCTALMRAYSYEVDLLTQQYNQKLGIFACTAYAVYSNQEMILAEGLATKKVCTSMMCQTGGEFKTALNLRIFAAFWKQIFVDGDFLNFNFFIKADPDTVFMFHRLQPLLSKYDQRASGPDGRGVYFNNCKYGMHGPLEVFSQNALLALQGLFKTCYFYFRKLCSGDCHWGEDLWCDQCLKRKANRTIDRVNLYDLLQERHCDPPEDWDSCSDPDVVAFHPFKSLETWQNCHANTF